MYIGQYGRAHRSHRWGHRFESCCDHQNPRSKGLGFFLYLVLAYVLSAYTASGAVNFNKEKFIKEVKTTAKAMNLTDQTLTSFTDGLEKLLKRKRISEKEAQEYCAQFLKKNA